MAQKQARGSLGNQVEPGNAKVEPVAAMEQIVDTSVDFEDEIEGESGVEDDEDAPGQRDHMHEPVTLHLSRSLIRKLRDNSREEGVTMEELASELVAEGVVLRAWEIVERKATMRGGNANQGNSQGNQNNFNRGTNGIGNHGNHQQPHQTKQHFTPGNKMAQKKLQRQHRQHANAMDLMSDKAAFIEYVRNQEKKRR